MLTINKTEQWRKRLRHPNSLKQYLPEFFAVGHFPSSSEASGSGHHSLGNFLLDVGMGMPGAGRSLMIRVIGKCWQLNQPFSAALLQHYVGGSGEPFDLNKFGKFLKSGKSGL